MRTVVTSALSRKEETFLSVVFQFNCFSALACYETGTWAQLFRFLCEYFCVAWSKNDCLLSLLFFFFFFPLVCVCVCVWRSFSSSPCAFSSSATSTSSSSSFFLLLLPSITSRSYCTGKAAWRVRVTLKIWSPGFNVIPYHVVGMSWFLSKI